MAYLAQELESVQKRAMRIIFLFRPYNEVLHESGLIRLSERRQAMVGSLFEKITEN
jgi:hypothetical protein